MVAPSQHNEPPEHSSESMQVERIGRKEGGVIGNERLTALVSFVLLVLIIVELGCVCKVGKLSSWYEDMS